MKTILITGANRGLGYEFTRQYLESGNMVIATCRNPEKASALQELHTNYKDTLSILQLEVTSEEAITGTVDKAAQRSDTIDILINNAGVGHWDPLEGTTFDLMTDSYRINAVAPLLITRAFLPLLKKAERPLAAFITSLLGSIARREEMGMDSGSFCYNASKAALNMIGAMLALQLKEDGIIVLLQSPGWASTDMGGKEAANTPREVVTGMIEIFQNATLHDSGKFLQWTGEELPW